MSLLELTAVELAKEIKAGKTTAVEAMKAVLEQIEKTEETYHCYITIDKEKAMQAAKEAQEKIEAGTLTGPLAGVPVAIKDNLCTKGVVTTCASKILENFVPQYDAEAVVKLQEAGAVMIGKTNMDEFAMGSTTETSAYGVTKNPRNPEHVPGGSSGGSAAAVAADECFFALGSVILFFSIRIAFASSITFCSCGLRRFGCMRFFFRLRTCTCSIISIVFIRSLTLIGIAAQTMSLSWQSSHRFFDATSSISKLFGLYSYSSEYSILSESLYPQIIIPSDRRSAILIACAPDVHAEAAS